MKTLPALLLAACLTVPDISGAILTITGASELEELSESEIERFQRLAASPLDLNAAGRSRLLSCGLFSSYQVASLMDRRNTSGDILSFVELALVDGFGERYAQALSHFVVLRTSSPPGQRRGTHVSHNLTLRGSVRADQDADVVPFGGLKYVAEAGERFQFSWATRNTYSDQKIGLGTISAVYYGKRHLGKLVLGNFNARFGQGLALWSGFSLSSLSTVSSFRRSGTGISATSSYTSELVGAAADWNFGRWTVTTAYAWPALPILGAAWTSRVATLGLTATSEAVSADWRVGLKNLSLYGEVASLRSDSWRPSASCGLLWIPAYGRSIGLLARYLEGIPEVAAGVSLPWLEATVDCKFGGASRIVCKVAPELTFGRLSLTPSFRLNERYSLDAANNWRSDARMDMDASIGAIKAHTRINLVHSEALSWLANAEIGWDEVLRCFLRWTLFCVDHWDDRIYVYERDVPGSFNVPAYYGRGWALSLTGGWKISGRHALHFRASTIQYPWTESGKPSRNEFRLQYVLSL